MTLRPHDLYDPAFEHDACGIGMVCRIDGRPAHEIVRQGLQILCRLEHRGAVGADPLTGDGAGILLQIPHGFLRAEFSRQNVRLPRPGDYAVGAVMISPGVDVGATRKLVAECVTEAGLSVLGWRSVPKGVVKIGVTARAHEPSAWHVAIGRPRGVRRGLDFAQRLFIARRRMERGANGFHVASLSARTLVYKGMLTVEQLGEYYPDLADPALKSASALVHSRFSTNTMPQWPLAQPFRYLCHNGEINTVRGNANWMRAREGLLEAEGIPKDVLEAVLDTRGSDSQQLDQALELLCMTGRSLPHAVMMLIPEAWERARDMDEDVRGFYEYHACLMEPWDGPAAVLFSDGRYAGAVLDRNGLRPARYVVTHDGLLVLGSEAGTLDLDPADVKENGRLQPGRMLLVDLDAGRLVSDQEIKQAVAAQQPYRAWIADHMRLEAELPEATDVAPALPDDLTSFWQFFGYTRESLEIMLRPMAEAGKDPIGSMGRDVPLAVLSEQPRPLFDYFKQLFAQVTNPPLDAIREELVTSLHTYLGGTGNLVEEVPEHASVIRLETPVLSEGRVAALAQALPTVTLRTWAEDPNLEAALESMCAKAEFAVLEGARLVVLTDRDVPVDGHLVPSLLAVGAVHHHLTRKGIRMRCSLVVQSGEPREVHHLCTLVGYGANAVNPWLALATARTLAPDNPDETERLCTKAFEAGLLKVMSKMGISTVRSYCGAQVFEAVGLAPEVIQRCFDGTPSRIRGLGFWGIAATYESFRRDALQPASRDLAEGGLHRWRRDGEHHTLGPMEVANLQEAVRNENPESYQAFADGVNDQVRKLGTLRGMMRIAPGRKKKSISLAEVEPWTEIVQRFKTGAMSYGSISGEAHSTLAEAMNHLGGRSNTGEGGEDPVRYDPAHPARSRIKQVASGRFGVTIEYLTSADEIQIKMAQGAKPGEGGQLPGEKVYPWIARTRHSTPWVGLISPPPHHDIYSIEDLAQLIYDLRNANEKARVSVKLVSRAGVGTIAAGVAKAKADVVLISGFDGGTGASARTSIMHAGLPWELGLAETHQTLVRNGLRNRIKVECDGGLKTGRDVVIAALLGADEFGFATAPLVAMGCVMMRKCHLNTCPVGIATQNPELRERFAGEPEHVINYFHFVAQEVRQIMASLGVRTMDELVGRTDLLSQREDTLTSIDLSRVIARAQPDPRVAGYDLPARDDMLDDTLDRRLVAQAADALERGEPVVLEAEVSNQDRTIGTQLSAAIARSGSSQDVTLNLRGTAGQSLCAFGASGLHVHLTGQANDYFSKGLSGARVIVSPPENVGFRPHEQIVVGNVALYGATSGEVFIRGGAGERFAVRNSGATAVVEGVGDHGCEYMTGGRVVVLGPTGRNFAAGMSGGIAYVLDGTRDFRHGRCSQHGLDLESLSDPLEMAELQELVIRHRELTRSDVAAWVLDNWEAALAEFVKVIPREYKEALIRIERDDQTVAA